MLMATVECDNLTAPKLIRTLTKMAYAKSEGKRCINKDFNVLQRDGKAIAEVSMASRKDLGELHRRLAHMKVKIEEDGELKKEKLLFRFIDIRSVPLSEDEDVWGGG